jgi:peptidoglycan-N-acetylglucosamine deacetylase
VLTGSLLFMTHAAKAGSGSIANTESPPPPRVAITVDDIPNHGDLIPGFTRAEISHDIIKAFSENGVTSVRGFTNGTFMEDNPGEISILKEWLAAGFPLGNHTYDHMDLTKVSARAFVRNVAKQDRLLSRLVTFSPLIKDRFVFRYPYLDEGNTLVKRDKVRTYLFKHGYRVAQVTTDYFDWAWTDAFTRCTNLHDEPQIAWLKRNIIVSADRHLHESRAVAQLLFKRDIPQILLIHVGVFDAIMLNAILKHWRAEGVRFISLDAALADPAYAINPNVIYSDGRDFLAQIAMARKIDIGPLVDSTYSIDRLNLLCPEKGVHP